MATKDDERFVYIYNYADPWYCFQLFIGTRGDGKTYGSLGGAIVVYLIIKYALYIIHTRPNRAKYLTPDPDPLLQAQRAALV